VSWFCIHQTEKKSQKEFKETVDFVRKNDSMSLILDEEPARAPSKKEKRKRSENDGDPSEREAKRQIRKKEDDGKAWESDEEDKKERERKHAEAKKKKRTCIIPLHFLPHLTNTVGVY
jgi:hypothetical protein